jgi:Ser/Thr protein kinase RdoA (MazF antagonist)
MTAMPSRLPTDAVHDLALADREPDIPRFLDVLSPDRALASLSDQFPRQARVPTDPRVVYLRYKPGASLTATVAARGAEPLILLQAVSVHHRPKIEKLLTKQHHGATGWGVVSDPGHLLAAGVPASDRHLPWLGRSGRGHSAVAGLDLEAFRPLRYKPQRRWVATGTHDGRLRVVRVVPPAFAQACAPTLGHLADTGLLRHFHQDARRGVSIQDWIEGQTLVATAAEPSLLADVGHALARLHTLPHGPVHPAPDHRLALTQAGAAIGVLCPELAIRARQLAAVLGEGIPAEGPRVVSHGDFSDDQVVIAPDGQVHLIDFDRACLDHPAFDLGSWLSQELVHRHEAGTGRATGIDALSARFQALLDGYALVAPVPEREAIMACALAALFRRAVDPFRQRHPAWSEGVARRLELLEQLLASRVRALR